MILLFCYLLIIPPNIPHPRQARAVKRFVHIRIGPWFPIHCRINRRRNTYIPPISNPQRNFLFLLFFAQKSPPTKQAIILIPIIPVLTKKSEGLHFRTIRERSNKKTMVKSVETIMENAILKKMCFPSCKEIDIGTSMYCSFFQYMRKQRKKNASYTWYSHIQRCVFLSSFCHRKKLY